MRTRRRCVVESRRAHCVPPPRSTLASPAAAATPMGALPQALRVQRSLTRDDEVGPGQLAPEVDQVEDGVDPGPGRGPEHRHRAERGSPAAPAPGVWLSSRPVAAWTSCAHRVIASSKSTNCSAVAPFGVRRQRWLRSDRAADCRRRRLTGIAPRAPPGADRSDPLGRRGAVPPAVRDVVSPGIENAAPSACSIPAPPSVDALPPRPTMISRAPPSSACLMTVPSPNVLAPKGSSAPPGRLTNPTAEASSTTAVDPRIAYEVAMADPSARWSSPRRASSRRRRRPRPFRLRHRLPEHT